MAKPKGIILTGSSGYLGSQLLKFFDPNLFIICKNKSFTASEPIFFSHEGKVVQNITSKFSSFTIVHLATYFSKKTEDTKLIYDANINYGNRLLKNTEHLNIDKFIYTNTMFGFYKNPKIRELDYTKTKLEFSKILMKYSYKNNVPVDEIFLDNTFGGNDQRDKIIPNIALSVLNNSPSPVVNKDTFINLIYFKDVLKRITNSINNEIKGSTAFINSKTVNVQSIYEYLSHFYKTKNSNVDLLKYGLNNFIEEQPKINYFDNEISDIGEKLIFYLNNLTKLNNMKF